MRSEIRGQPPIETSPRPSATGSLHGAVVSAAGFTVAAGVGEAEVVGSGIDCAAGFAMATPLFQINFLPDLTQVNLVVAVEEVAPSFVQEVPALTAA
jgi:hypothetical protein